MQIESEQIERKILTKEDFEFKQLCLIPKRFKVDPDLKTFLPIIEDDLDNDTKYKSFFTKTLENFKNKIHDWETQIDGSLTFGQIDEESWELEGLGTRIDDLGNIEIGEFHESRLKIGMVFIKGANVMISNIASIESVQEKEILKKISKTRFIDGDYYRRIDGPVHLKTLNEYLISKETLHLGEGDFGIVDFVGEVRNYKRSGKATFGVNDFSKILKNIPSYEDQYFQGEGYFKDGKLHGAVRFTEPETCELTIEFDRGKLTRILSFFTIDSYEDQNLLQYRRIARIVQNTEEEDASSSNEYSLSKERYKVIQFPSLAIDRMESLCNHSFTFLSSKNPDAEVQYLPFCGKFYLDFQGQGPRPIRLTYLKVESQNNDNSRYFVHCYDLMNQMSQRTYMIDVDDYYHIFTYMSQSSEGNSRISIFGNSIFRIENDTNLESAALSSDCLIDWRFILYENYFGNERDPFGVSDAVKIDPNSLSTHVEYYDFCRKKIEENLGNDSFVKRAVAFPVQYYHKFRLFYIFQDTKEMRICCFDEDLVVEGHFLNRLQEKSLIQCQIQYLAGPLKGYEFRGIYSHYFKKEISGVYLNSSSGSELEFDSNVSPESLMNLKEGKRQEKINKLLTIPIRMKMRFGEFEVDCEKVKGSTKYPPTYTGRILDQNGSEIFKGEIGFEKFYNKKKYKFYLGMNFFLDHGLRDVLLNSFYLMKVDEVVGKDEVKGELRFSSGDRSQSGLFKFTTSDLYSKKKGFILQKGVTKFQKLVFELKFEDRHSCFEIRVDQSHAKGVFSSPPAKEGSEAGRVFFAPKGRDDLMIHGFINFKQVWEGAFNFNYDFEFFDCIRLERRPDQIREDNAKLRDSCNPTSVKIDPKGLDLLNRLFEGKFLVRSEKDVQVELFCENVIEMSLLVTPRPMLFLDYYKDDAIFDQIDPRLRRSFKVRLHHNGKIERGDFIMGSIQGRGEVSYEEDGPIKKISTRHFEGSIVSGEALVEYKNGDIYEGVFRLDQKHGKGKMRYSNGDTYQGDFYLDLKHGKGVYNWCSNGAVYDGEFKAGGACGVGHLTLSNGYHYNGEVEGGKFHGGKWTEANGEEVTNSEIQLNLESNFSFGF